MTNDGKGVMGFRTLLLGDSGDGKSHSLRTLVEAGVTPMCILTEPPNVHGDVPAEKMHWHYVAPVKKDWKAYEQQVKTLATSTHQQLCKAYDMQRHTDNRMLEFIATCNRFVCDRTGEDFGPVGEWGTDRCLVVDSLTGLVMMMRDAVAGNRLCLDISDYGPWQDGIENAINQLSLGVRCHFVVTAHVEMETEQTTMERKLMAALPGKKLAQSFGRFFDDVVACKRDGKVFTWSTTEKNMKLKARNLPWEDKMKPSFVPIVEKWKERGGVIAGVKEEEKV